jgi:4-methyl-5(b-hydroxyethyl)-thiazole monophosphate biosynthesis
VENKKVLLLLANGFEAYEASVFTDIIGFANSGGFPIELKTAGNHKALNCAYGFRVIPEYQVAEIDLDDFDALAIPGGRRDAGFYDDSYSPEFQDVIKHFNEQNKYIAGICVASLPMANAGVLYGKKATTYFGKKQIELAEMGIEVIDERVVCDSNIITSSSPSTGIEVAFKLLEKLTSEECVLKTKEAFGLFHKY